MPPLDAGLGKLRAIFFFGGWTACVPPPGVKRGHDSRKYRFWFADCGTRDWDAAWEHAVCDYPGQLRLVLGGHSRAPGAGRGAGAPRDRTKGGRRPDFRWTLADGGPAKTAKVRQSPAKSAFRGKGFFAGRGSPPRVEEAAKNRNGRGGWFALFRQIHLIPPFGGGGGKPYRGLRIAKWGNGGVGWFAYFRLVRLFSLGGGGRSLECWVRH